MLSMVLIRLLSQNWGFRKHNLTSRKHSGGEHHPWTCYSVMPMPQLFFWILPCPLGPLCFPNYASRFYNPVSTSDFIELRALLCRDHVFTDWQLKFLVSGFWAWMFIVIVRVGSVPGERREGRICSLSLFDLHLAIFSLYFFILSSLFAYLLLCSNFPFPYRNLWSGLGPIWTFLF